MKIGLKKMADIFTVMLFLMFLSVEEVQAADTEPEYLIYDSYTYCVEEDGMIKIVGYTGNERVVNIPSEMNGIPVGHIAGLGKYANGYYSYYINDKTRKVIVPDGVVSIESFNGHSDACMYVEEVILPDSVTRIAKDAFIHCEGLKRIHLPKGLKELEAGTFSFCSSLKSIQLPSGLKRIGRDAFFECSSLTEIRIPDTVTSIGEDTFCGCRSLKKVTLSKNLTVLSEGLFEYCLKLKSIQIPKKVSRIEARAFLHIPMSNVKIPENVTWIGERAFWSYQGKTKNITIKSKKLKHLGLQAFSPKTGAMYDVPNKYIKNYKQMLIKKKCFAEGKMEIK